MRAVDEALDATQCGGRENCKDEERCLTHELWTTLNFKMYEYLESVTLADLLDRRFQKPDTRIMPLKEVRRNDTRIHEDASSARA